MKLAARVHRRRATRAVTQLVGIAALAALMSGCLLTSAPPPTGAAPLRYRDQIFTSYGVTRDIQYGSAPGRNGVIEALKLDLYQPTGDTVAKRPVVIWAHGGGFSGGDKRDDEYLVAPFVKRGFVAASINYRLLSNGCSGSTNTPECEAAARAGINDGQAAVRWFRANAATYGIDPLRVAFAGFSAGGVMATGVGLMSDQPGESGNPGYSSTVNGWVSVAGGLPAASVTELVQRSDPAGYLFHGTADPTVPYQWAVDTANALHNAGSLAVLKTQQGGGHSLPDLGVLAQESSNFLYITMNLASAER